MTKKMIQVVFSSVLLTYNVSSQANPAPAHVADELLATAADLHQEYCENDYFYLKFKSFCYVPPVQTLKIYVPDSFASVIAAQVLVMEKQKNFLALSPEDFFHGHLVVFGHEATYATLEALLADTTAYLFHTDEFSNRFGTLGDGKPEHQVQRSLVARPNLPLVNAIDLIDKDKVLRSYTEQGTIFVEDLLNSQPQLSQIVYHGESNQTDLLLNYKSGGQSYRCTVDSQFYIRLQTDGRYQLQDGSKFDVYVLCALATPVASPAAFMDQGVSPFIW